MKSDAHREHIERDRSLKEWLKEWINEVEIYKAIENARNAVNKALKINTRNVRSDLLDFMPIATLGNPRLFLFSVLLFSVSLYYSIREYKFRKNTLNPAMEKVREEYTQMSDDTHIDHVHPIRDNLDIGFEWIETIVELFSFFLPNLMLPWYGAPFFEIPLDTHSRKNYYDLAKELEYILAHIENLETKKELS